MRVAALGISDFEDIRTEPVFYVDKTDFIRQWWESRDKITLITRPRRFGKTLTLSMAEVFFSVKYAGRADLFEGLSIWEREEYRQLQGKYPVINLSLANVKENTYGNMIWNMAVRFSSLFKRHSYLLKSEQISKEDKKRIQRFADRQVGESDCQESLLFLSECLYQHFGKNVFILIDEYDTPLLEAYTEGYWEEAVVFIRRLFHGAFKDNPYLERGLMTGITRITQESVFSDLNNLRAVTATTNMYESCFGFTEEEVFSGLEEFGLGEEKAEVKRWYDGFRFGEASDIYNPWSILNFLSMKEYKPYWMNTSSNKLVSQLVQLGMLEVKQGFEKLLAGGSIISPINENITYARLSGNTVAVWSFLLATGYVKVSSRQPEGYELSLTNYEVREAFCELVGSWFEQSYDHYHGFLRMLVAGNLEGMQRYMDKVLRETFSYFDVGGESTVSERTEQFYHGFVLGLIADLKRTHIVTSNRESGFGRYDISIEPLDKNKDGILIEFKVFDGKKESSLEEAADRALGQIEERNYEADLKARGILNVRKYGFAFHGKEVLIRDGGADQGKKC